MKKTIRRHSLPATVCLAVMLTVSTVLAQSQPSPAMRAELRPLIQACMADARQFCQGVERGGGRILACLNQHGDSVSAPCRDAITTLQARIAERKQTQGLVQ